MRLMEDLLPASAHAGRAGPGDMRMTGRSSSNSLLKPAFRRPASSAASQKYQTAMQQCKVSFRENVHSMSC